MPPRRRSGSFVETRPVPAGPVSAWPSFDSCKANHAFGDSATPCCPALARKDFTAGKDRLANFGGRNDDYDSEGRCVRHPNNQPRERKALEGGGSAKRKKAFGGWKVLTQACPDCCLEEMRRRRLNDSSKG